MPTHELAPLARTVAPRSLQRDPGPSERPLPPSALLLPPPVRRPLLFGRWVLESRLQRLIETIADAEPPPPWLVFESADQRFLERAWPLLRGRGLPVALAVWTGCVGQHAVSARRGASSRMLRWMEIGALAEEGVEIFLWGHRPLVLERTRLDVACTELLRARQEMALRAGWSADTLVLAGGVPPAPLLDLVARIGYRRFVAIEGPMVSVRPRWVPALRMGRFDRVPSLLRRLRRREQLQLEEGGTDRG